MCTVDMVNDSGFVSVEHGVWPYVIGEWLEVAVDPAFYVKARAGSVSLHLAC